MKKALFGALCGLALAIIAFAPSRDAKAALKGSIEESIVKVTFRGNPYSGGTGFVIQTPNKGKVVITNAHVCAGGTKDGVVVLSGKGLARDVEARIIESRSEQDLCVVDAPFFMKPLTLGTAPVIGQHVSVIGHPHLRPLTLTEGYIRDLDFLVKFYDDPEETDCDKSNQTIESVATMFGFVKACVSSYHSYDMDVTIYPGNSGSPLVDDDGLVIGVAFATSSAGGASNALRFEALKAMGYSHKEAKDALDNIPADLVSTSDKIKAALRVVEKR